MHDDRLPSSRSAPRGSPTRCRSAARSRRPATARGRRRSSSPAADLDGLDTLPALRSQFRTHGWIAPIDPARRRTAGDIDDLLRGGGRGEAASLQRATPAFTLEAPDAALLRRAADARVAERRILVVGGIGAALLLGFALLAATTVRRDVHAEWRRLELRGARRWHLWLFAVAELGWIALAGLVVGVRGRRRRRRPRGATSRAWGLGDRRRARCSRPTACWRSALAWVVATVVLVAAQRPSLPSRGRIASSTSSRWQRSARWCWPPERGTAGAGGLDQDTDPLLPLVPVLASLVVGILAYRIVGPLARLGERATRGASTARLALVAIARRPEAAAATVAFLAVSIGLAVFAELLPRDAGARAARPGGLRGAARRHRDRRPRPRARRSTRRRIDQYAAIQPGADALPVLRRNATVPSVGTPSAARRGAGRARLGADATCAGAPTTPTARRSRWRRRSRRATSPGCATTPVPEGATRAAPAGDARRRLRRPAAATGRTAVGQPVRVDLGVVKSGQQTVEIDVAAAGSPAAPSSGSTSRRRPPPAASRRTRTPRAARASAPRRARSCWARCRPARAGRPDRRHRLERRSPASTACARAARRPPPACRSPTSSPAAATASCACRRRPTTRRSRSPSGRASPRPPARTAPSRSASAATA